MELTQSIVLSILAAAIQQKSILITSLTRLDRAVALTQKAVSILFDKSRPSVIKCEKWTNWKSLENDIQHAARVSEFVLICNPAHLDNQTQAYLTEIVQSGRYRIIFLGPSKGIRRILRNALFFQLSMLTDGENAVSAESPKQVTDQLPHLRQKASQVHISSEILRYAQDIIVFVRTHRFVSRGVPPSALRDLNQLMRILCVFAGLEYATPAIVAGAVRLVVPLKIELCEPSEDLSLEYGSDLDIVTSWLKNWDTGIVVDNIISLVPCPL